ncbi:MAG: IS1 family transposase [Bacteroidales bacterium]|nr:IS1 family transposase [Bacteroidales bacterium]
MDEIYWFINKKERSKTRENTYIMTMISREPRQIVGFDVQFDKGVFRLQGIVDNAPEAENYSTDGNPSYCDVIFPGKHNRNIRDKRDTHTIESINADLRHYISGLARRSRCFYRSIETLQAVLEIFVDAYNKFGEYKLKYRVPVIHKNPNNAKHLHKYRDLPLSILDFL